MAESRRSSRLKDKKPILSYDDEEDKYEIGDLPVSVASPHKHKRTKTKRSDEDAGYTASINPNRAAHGEGTITKRKKGMLASLPDLPLDILYEIFGYLHPLDLIRLSRLTKALRSVLLRRSARSVWINALAGVEGMPACPPDLQEPQWARLIFDSHCFFCGSSGTKVIFWTLRVRTCKKCYQDESEEGDGSPFIRGWDKGYGTRVYLRKEYNAVKEHNSSLTTSASAQYLEQREEHARTRVNDPLITKYGDWLEEMRTDRSQELSEMRQKRQDDILARFRDIGFSREAAFLPGQAEPNPAFKAFEQHKLFRAAQPLTTKAWNRIRPILTPLMEDVRKARIKLLRRKILRGRIGIIRSRLSSYRESLEEGEERLVPQLHDICLMDPFNRVLKLPSDDVDEDTITASAFDEAFAQLPQLISEFQQNRKLRLLRVLRTHTEKSSGSDTDSEDEQMESYSSPIVKKRTLISSNEEANDPSDHLSLATAVFSCRHCSVRNSLTPYDALKHYCPPFRAIIDTVAHLSEDDKEIFCLMSSAEISWNYTKCLTVDDAAQSFIATLVEECGLDPLTATRSDMDATDARYLCAERQCLASSSLNSSAYDWRSMVAHWQQAYFRQPGDKLCRILSPERATIARELEVARSPAALFWVSAWTCRHCTECKDKTPRALEQHLQVAHHITDWKPQDYSVKIPDSFQERLGPPVEISRVTP